MYGSLHEYIAYRGHMTNVPKKLARFPQAGRGPRQPPPGQG